tara:strand:- start:714 stop:1070 length:357 start_codon:yes stop_codon:yes gene_type:complete
MPVLKKEFELDNGMKIMVRQASGLEKMRIEAIQARTIRKCRDFGTDVTDWTDEQHMQFMDMLIEAGGGVDVQAQEWLPKCILEPEGFDPNILTSDEIRDLLQFIRGDETETEGAIPLA